MIIKNVILIILTSILAVSCNSYRKTSYRIVGKNGDVVYFDKRRPEFNIEQLKKQKDDGVEDGDDKGIKKNGGKTKKNSKDTSKAELDVFTDKEKQKLRKDSSAYTLRTVMDNVLKNENINELAQEIEKSKTVSKTIRDFSYIPDLYFEDIGEDKKLTATQNANFLKSTKYAANSFDKIEDIKKQVSSASLKKDRYYLQLGSFSTKQKAEAILKKNNFGKETSVVEFKKNGRILYRAILGTYITKSDADSAKQRVIENGHFDVMVFKY